jgi:WD40 repeat protein
VRNQLLIMTSAWLALGTACRQAVPIVAMEPIVASVKTVSSVGRVAGTLLCHGGKLYVSSFRRKEIAVVDLQTLKQTASIKLGTDSGKPKPKLTPPGDMAIAGGKLFVAQVFTKLVVVVDLKTLQPVGRLELGGSGRFAVAPDGKTIYYASNDRREFHVIDVATHRFRTVAYPKGGRGIGSAMVSPGGKRLYLGIQRGGQHLDGVKRGGGNAFLAVYDLEKNKYTGTVYLALIHPDNRSDDSIPQEMIFSPDGRTLYIAMMQSFGGIFMVDTRTLKIADNVALALREGNPVPFANPAGLALCDGRLLILNSANRELIVLDAKSYEVRTRVPLGRTGQPRAFVLHDRRAYVSWEDANLLLQMIDLRPALKQQKGGANRPAFGH